MILPAVNAPPTPHAADFNSMGTRAACEIINVADANVNPVAAAATTTATFLGFLQGSGIIWKSSSIKTQSSIGFSLS